VNRQTNAGGSNGVHVLTPAPTRKRRLVIARPRDCTFAENDWNILSRHWYPIAVAADVQDRPVQSRLLDLDLVLFRSGGKAVVARDLCPHRGMTLSRGWVDAGQIICPYHGLHFAGDGRCTSIPSRPDAQLSDRLSLTIVPSVERYGLIWATLAGEETDAETSLPKFEAWTDPAFQPVVCHPVDIAGSSGRQIEGFLDVAHFAWAHTGTFGNRANPVVPDYTVENTETGLKVHYVSDVSNFGPDQRDRAPPDFLWRRTFEVFPPFAARLVVDYPEGRQLWILNAVCPVSARKTRLYCPIARDFDKDSPVEALREFNARVFNEDRVLVENQKPEDLPLDLGQEISIPADRTSVAYRRLLKQMGLSLVYAG
jgi:vanillate O-demethylase monooxygenase subunit